MVTDKCKPPAIWLCHSNINKKHSQEPRHFPDRNMDDIELEVQLLC